ncbi:MAG TPA: ATP-binding protein [Polyangia bacterium]|jgi:signal transduction histidine kinase
MPRVRLGLRAQLLVALSAVALLMVVSAGVLSQLVTQQSFAAYEDESLATLARAAAGALGAARDPARTLADDVHTGRLGTVARSLVRGGAFRSVLVVDRDGRALIAGERSGAAAAAGPAAPPRDAAGLATALGGVERLERVARGAGDAGGPGTELRAYLPLRGPAGLEGALRLSVSLDAAVGAAEARSRRLLLGLGLFDGGVLLLLGGFLLGRMIVRPIAALEQAADGIARGERSVRVAEDGPGEIGSLAASFNRMTAALADKVAELETRGHELRASREQLVRAERLASVGRLAAGLAHEIGNPLSAMLGYVEILRGDPPPDPALTRDVLDRLHREIERIHRIMQDLLTYSRPAPERALPVDVREVAAAALALMRPQRRFQDVALACEMPADLPPVVASPGRLTQVLVNLLLNAADAVAGQGRVTCRARRDGDAVVVEVADSGPGVPPDLREQIFDPFFTTKEPGQGTGLGLATSRSLCESFEAALELVDTPPGGGATFAVRLKPA